MSIFPFTFYHDEAGVRNLWLTHRKDIWGDKTWYEIDVTFHSPTKVSFDVYDIKCNVYGGRGDFIATCETTVTPEESSEFITKRVKRMAVARFEEEERLAKITRVIHIMGDIFAENEKELEV